MANQPKSLTYFDILPAESVAMDPDAFDNLLRNHGVRMHHWRAMRCPVGLTDPFDIRGSHEHHIDCSNGYLYRCAGTVTVLFTGNGSSNRLVDAGLIDGSSAQVTFPRFYDSQTNKQVHVSYADRFFLEQKVAETVDWTTIRAHETGIERLQFPATRVEHVIDNSGREYDPALYCVDGDGRLKWSTQDRPVPGAVLTVWYVYQPFWYVSRLLHEIRLTQVVDPISGEPRIERMPYSCILQRENVFKNEKQDDQVESKRQQVADESGGFGPR